MAVNVDRLGSGEPCSKKKKTDEKNVFVDFLKDKNKLRLVKEAYECLLEGKSDMRVRVLKLLESNARVSEGFSRASCKTKMYEIDEVDPPMGLIFPIKSIFKTGLFILREFLSSDPGIPEDFKQQEALRKLLIFMTADHSALQECKKCDESNWAIRLAQHLLYPLSVAENYTIDDNCKAVNKYNSQVCPCKEGDRLKGYFGDTSYGWIDGWHGRTDILVNDVAVDLADKDTDEDLEIGASALSTSISSTEVKSTNNFTEKDKQQILAQTIVFSFLQRKEKKGDMKNFLVPGIGISKENVIGYFYDSEEDVLLGTPNLDLFAYKSLCYNTVVFIWLTLNYKIFCSGITDPMKKYKAEFFNRVGDFLDNYRNNVTRGVPQKQKGNDNDVGWAKLPNFESETNVIEETGENLGVKILRIDKSSF